MRGNHFVHGHEKDLPHITCIFHLLKYVAIFLVSAVGPFEVKSNWRKQYHDSVYTFPVILCS